MFEFAQQPDILRSSRKDLFYVAELRDRFFEVCSNILRSFLLTVAPLNTSPATLATQLTLSLATRFSILHQSEIRLLSDLTYFAMTTLRGFL